MIPGLFHALGSGVAELGKGTVVQTTLMGMALSPGHFLGMNAGSFALISGGMALGHNRLVTALLLLPLAHEGHKERLVLRGVHRILWGCLHAFIL